MNRYQQIVALVKRIEKQKQSLKKDTATLRTLTRGPQPLEEPLKLSGAVAEVLETFEIDKPLSLQDVVKKTGLKKNTVGPVLSKLTMRGLLVREGRGFYRKVKES